MFGARERSNSTFTLRVTPRTRKRINSTPLPGQKKNHEMMDLSSRQRRLDGSLLDPNVNRVDIVSKVEDDEKQHERED